jgi:hypothetical protein
LTIFKKQLVAVFHSGRFAKRAKRTTEFAAAKSIDVRGVGWREKLDALFFRGLRIPKELEDKVVLRIARLWNREE